VCVIVVVVVAVAVAVVVVVVQITMLSSSMNSCMVQWCPIRRYVGLQPPSTSSIYLPLNPLNQGIACLEPLGSPKWQVRVL
jgi:hypothetical protein